jgi:hypothetical protein
MTKNKNKWLARGSVQLNLIGLALLLILAVSARWLMSQPDSVATVVPLIMIVYAALKIIYELTFNRANVPTLATTRAARRRIADIIAADAKQRDAQKYIVVDLGAGRGELARRIARSSAAIQVYAIEKAWLPHAQSKLIGRLFGPPNVVYRDVDFWPFDCGAAQAVVLYLNPGMARKAGEKLAREMVKDGLIVSYNFPLLGAWQPAETIEFKAPFKETIYIYRKDY